MGIRFRSMVLLALSGACSAADVSAPSAAEPDSFWEALAGGKPDLFLRYRFESVDDNQAIPPLRDAYAHTLRTALGYSTGLFRGFGAQLQVEDVRTIGAERFNDGGSNGVLDRAVVVDPEGTEVQQANLRFEGITKTTLKLGRQEIEHRQAPLHRYLGNILWRQNWQSFDAFRATSLFIPGMVIDYGYIWNVNRIFGEDNPIPDRSNFRMDGHYVNIQYSGLPIGKLEPYAYLLDFSNTSDRFSTQTFGIRLEGAHALASNMKLLYTAEYAHQSDYQENPNDIDVDYWLAEAGVSTSPGGFVSAITAKVSYEVLGGDGGVSSLQTPLGTNHAFQGWADRFLITPGDGIQNLFLTLKATVGGATAMVVYHDLRSDHDGYDYGSEWDLLLEKLFYEHYTVGLKYATYDADRNAMNLARNAVAGQAFDLTKFWAYLQVRF